LDGKELPAPQTITVKKLRVATEVLDIVKMGEKEFPLRASELFSLVRDDSGNWGFSTNEKANLNIFMKKMKVSHPKELVGKQVVVLAKSTGFLGFNAK